MGQNGSISHLSICPTTLSRATSLNNRQLDQIKYPPWQLNACLFISNFALQFVEDKKLSSCVVALLRHLTSPVSWPKSQTHKVFSQSPTASGGNNSPYHLVAVFCIHHSKRTRRVRTVDTQTIVIIKQHFFKIFKIFYTPHVTMDCCYINNESAGGTVMNWRNVVMCRYVCICRWVHRCMCLYIYRHRRWNEMHTQLILKCLLI